MEKKNNKIIHYIWYGGNPLSDLTKKCIQTWKKFLPDFEIMEWNENTFDVNQCPFVKEAFEQKKWAFVADYTRFKVLEEYGGIYLDTDMEITKDIAEFLEKDLFLGVEDSKMINAAVVWAREAHNPHIQNIVKIYESKKCFNETGDLYDESVPRVLTKYFETLGFDKELDEIQILDNDKVYIYPMEYFYPLSYDYQNNKFTDNSAMIHHFDATWISPMEKFKTKMKRKNMKWVVYVIDFFISIKNKIKFFANYRDLITFATMFIITNLVMLSFIPVESSSIVYDVSYENISKSVLQILVISFVWTFICAKVRNIDLNFYTDKLLNRKQEDIDNGLIINKPLDLKQTLALQKRERIIFVIQYIITILLSIFPIFQVATMVPSGYVVYIALFLINIYMIYVGINKKFKYRILELIPYGIILGLLVFCNFSTGLIVSIVTFVFILINLILNKSKKKRVICFIASYAICMIISIVGVLLSGLDTFEISFDLISDSIIDNCIEDIIPDNAITEFNYIKEYTSNSIKNIVENMSLLCNMKFYFICSIIISILLTIITKNRNYLFILALIILNSIQIISTGVNLSFLNVIILGVLILITVQRAILNYMDNR